MRGERLDSNRGDLVRARQLIEALRSQGHEVHVVEDAARAGATLVVSAYRRGAQRILPLRAARVLRDIGRWLHGLVHGRRVARHAREQAADVIVETQVNLAASGAAAARATGLPLLLDDCSPSEEEALLGAGLPALARYVFRQQAQAASIIVASSQALRNRLVGQGVATDKLVVIPNGADLPAYGQIDHAAARAELGLTDECVLGFLGSFQPWHGVELLVEAASRLAADHPIHVLLIGDGPMRESVLACARQLGLAEHITALGAVPAARVPRLLAAFDIAVLPGSNDYGHPMKLLDYAAAGLPTVAPDLPPVREVITDGVTGLLFPPGDRAALTRALARLAGAERLRHKLGRQARKHCARDNTWAARARALTACVTALPAQQHAEGVRT